jgi:hypothetical protein
LTPVVVLVFTEGDMDEYRVRLMANMAQIPWQRLASMRSSQELDASEMAGSLQPTIVDGNVSAMNSSASTTYELVPPFRKENEPAKPHVHEQERLRAATVLANRHLIMIDCTDSENSTYQIGRGGIPEIANVINSVFRKRKDCYPTCVWLDHISALADRMAEAVEAETDNKLQLILKRMPRQAGDKIAKPWNIPVFLLHQLSGVSNMKGVTAKFHHSEASGSKLVGEYASFCVQTGPTDEHGRCIWYGTKHRRSKRLPHRIVQVLGEFQAVADVSAHYVADPSRGTIISKAERDQFHEPASRNAATEEYRPEDL